MAASRLYFLFQRIAVKMLLTKVTLDISHKYVNPEVVARDVLRKRCSENMQQIYRRTTPMSKCDFNKVAKQFLIISGDELLENWG